MTKDQLVAQAFISCIVAQKGVFNGLVRKDVPQLDAEYFFSEFAKLEVDHRDFSVALVGFGPSSVELEAFARGAGLDGLGGVADDLNTAADWRNNASQHPKIIALAKGDNPGVNTLQHFYAPNSRELARGLLEWALDTDIFHRTGSHKILLQVLSAPNTLDSLVSLDTICDYLAEWHLRLASDQIDAPRGALSHLGLLADPKIFEASALDIRLQDNAELTAQIQRMPSSRIRDLRKRTAKISDEMVRDRRFDTLERIERLRANPSTRNLESVSYSEVRELFQAPPKPDDPDPKPTPDIQPVVDPSAQSPHDEVKVEALGLSLLLDNRQDVLEQKAAAIREAFEELQTGNPKEISGEFEIDGNTAAFKIAIDVELIGWLKTFCGEKAFGGLIKTDKADLRAALAQFATAEHIVFDPDQLATINTKVESLSTMLAAWDEDLADNAGVQLGLRSLWERFRELRAAILPEIEFLLLFRTDWLASVPSLSQTVGEYLDVAGELYRKVQENYQAMSDHSSVWAQSVLDAFLALDVVQVRVSLPEDKESLKAVLLPTHPLHLWRYQRLASLLRGLGSVIDAEDRKTVLQDCQRPEQFLSVIRLGSMPDGLGIDHILPVANDLDGLATFENFDNAYNGSDGVQTLLYALDQFAILYRNHTQPLRLAVVNPPEPPRFLATLVKILSSRRTETLASLRIELFFTPSHESRALAALSFPPRERDVLEGALESGRLELQVHEAPKELAELIDQWKSEPFHVVAIFDESTVKIRRRGSAEHLPMSPFCVRKSIKYNRREDFIELEVTADEPPFSDFMLLMNEAEKVQRGTQAYAWADAQLLRNSIDGILRGDLPPAWWTFLADRGLPTEAGLGSVRLLSRREGQRQTVLLAADYHDLSRRVRAVLASKCNLPFDEPEVLESLLKEGAQMVGGGLLELIRRKDGSVDPASALGLVGTLFAARDYRLRHPGSLIVSVDEPMARLWLRLGKKSGDRCDLVALRQADDGFVVECIEVKSSSSAVAKDTDEEVLKARAQLESGVLALQQAMPSTADKDDVLAPPRCEMLKEVFVAACRGRDVKAEDRAVWSQWLTDVFRLDGNAAKVQVAGQIVRVLITSRDKSPVRVIQSDPWPLSIHVLTEDDIEKLLRSESTATTDVSSNPPRPSKPDSDDDQGGQPSPKPPAPNPPRPVDAPSKRRADPGSAIRVRATPTGPERIVVLDDDEPPSVPPAALWPPVPNVLGMVGQGAVVRSLTAQIDITRRLGRPFTDKLIVGPAGVGKTTLARALSQRLFNEKEIFFSGADLKRARAIVERLQQLGKIPSQPGDHVEVEKCLLFIDEVHAIKSEVQDTLLSALDDERTTSIEGTVYSFKKVVFLMATTDAGKLSEAFNSRPDKIRLDEYTLEDLAGIVCLRGQQCLDGFVLPRDVCIEIAARMRCNPRRAVRVLEDPLLAYVNALLMEDEREPTLRELGEEMTLDRVKTFFEQRGIDLNGIDSQAKNYLLSLRQNDSLPQQRLQKTIGITNINDFNEVETYLQRLGLVTISSSGRSISGVGQKYLRQPFDLRDRISRNRD